MFIDVNPLAVSIHAPTQVGAVHIYQIHNRVINLVNSNNEMITLHRYNSGLSPMGWSLKYDDYFDILDELKEEPKILQTMSGDLRIGQYQLKRSYRALFLTISKKFQSSLSFNFFSKTISSYSNQTGLFGALNQIINQPLPVQIVNFVEQFIYLLNDQPFDFSPYIGLGPGLTPSFDDMMIGILSIFYSDSRVFNKDKSYLSSSLTRQKLETLTTKVSAEFLFYAQKGIFTTNILAVISLIRQYKTNSLSIDNLLSYGHTSGADILLGMWLGLLITHNIDLNKE